MRTENTQFVIALLESYCDRERKIAVLKYCLAHPTEISSTEQIETMTYSRGDNQHGSKSHISNKTLYIALNYKEQAKRITEESIREISDELLGLEECQKKLKYYVSLLEPRQADILQLVYFQRAPIKKAADKYELTNRSIERIKKAAITKLAEMYDYMEHFKQ